MTGQSGRSYSGLAAAERAEQRRRRLLEVGLDLLGDPNGPQDLTLRTVCTRAGLAQRYFYESFTDKDEFAAAVYDWGLAALVSGTQAAVTAAAGAGPRARARAGTAGLVHGIAADQRIGRLLFRPKQTSPVLVGKRFESTAMFVALFSRQLESREPDERADPGAGPSLLAHFLVGGVGQTLAAWLNKQLRIGADELIDQLVAALLNQPPNSGFSAPASDDSGTAT